MEQEFIRWLKAKTKTAHERKIDADNSREDNVRIELGIGDDAAIIEIGKRRIVVSSDSIAEGNHFVLEDDSELKRIGRKALAVNLSDIAAMGAKPFAAIVNFQLPDSFDLEATKELFGGIELLANEFGISIVGGDTNRWTGGLVVSITVFGCLISDSAWTMNGASPGDQVVVTGKFGGSILGRHFDFIPRINFARMVAGCIFPNAATDASDSLTMDLAHIAHASGVGFEIEENQIPITDDAMTLSKRSGKSPLEHALYDGEDFELIMALPESSVEKLMKIEDLPCPVTVIGRFLEAREFAILKSTGDRSPISIQGYSH